MYPINAQQLHSLIHEVVSTYVWQFLAKILNYDRQTQKPDFTAQWETLSEALSADVGKNLSHYFTITTAHEAQHRLDDILALVSNELASRTAVSETDRRIGLNEAWDTWRQMMEDDNWGQRPTSKTTPAAGRRKPKIRHVALSIGMSIPMELPAGIPSPSQPSPPSSRTEMPPLPNTGRFRDMYPGINSQYVRVIRSA